MLTGVVAGVAGVTLGVGAMARFGPVWWQVAGATLMWVVGVGVPVALGARRKRGGEPAESSWKDGGGAARGAVPVLVGEDDDEDDELYDFAAIEEAEAQARAVAGPGAEEPWWRGDVTPQASWTAPREVGDEPEGDAGAGAAAR